ncbi:quercetin dioxygenase-like cupin family protein [Bradyrhizobium sp. JR3.5]
MFRKLLLGLTVVAFAGAGAALAQQSGIKRTPLRKVDFPAGYNTVTAIAEVSAGGASGRHSHPGAETGYVLEGEVELVIDGKPPLKLKAGGSY